MTYELFRATWIAVVAEAEIRCLFYIFLKFVFREI